MNLLVLSEVFPPAIGGSGELLRNVYCRLEGLTIDVWADAAADLPPASLDGPLRISRTPMRVADWGVLSWAGLRQHLRQAWRIRQATRSATTAVHCARALPEGVGAWLAKLTGGRPYLCWAHGEDVTAAETSREHSFLARRVLHGAAAVFANSGNTASLLRTLGVRADRIHVVYPGVDAVRFHPDAAGAADLRARLIGDRDDLLLLTVGRLQRRKGHDLVLASLAELRRAGRRVRYVIVGDGSERDRLSGLSAELGLDDMVTFTGPVAAEELPAYFAAADIFCHPNRIDGNDIEGFGIVFLEAAASGVPVIGGASGGVPEALEDGVTGLLVSGTSAEELTGVITALIDDPERRALMGRAGRRRAVEAFSWERGAAKVAEIHRQVVGQP